MIGAVDIGGTKIAVGIVDNEGKVLSRMQAPTDPENYAAGIDLIARMLSETSSQAGVEVTGIGIGSTGPVDPIRGEFGDVDFLPGWRGKSPVKDLAERFKLRVALENDGDAAALGRSGMGSGTESETADLHHGWDRNRRWHYSRRPTLSRRRWRASRSRTPGDRSHWSGLFLRISRMLGVAGCGSGDGGLVREPCSRGQCKSKRDYSEAHL